VLTQRRTSFLRLTTIIPGDAVATIFRAQGATLALDQVERGSTSSATINRHVDAVGNIQPTTSIPRAPLLAVLRSRHSHPMPLAINAR
jgi:hypothetical protein